MYNSNELYKLWSSKKELLYVGVSVYFPNRLIQHKHKTPWFNEITSITIERFSSRRALLMAEAEAIKREKPKYNIMHNTAVREAAREDFLLKTLEEQHSVLYSNITVDSSILEEVCDDLR